MNDSTIRPDREFESLMQEARALRSRYISALLRSVWTGGSDLIVSTVHALMRSIVRNASDTFVQHHHSK